MAKHSCEKSWLLNIRSSSEGLYEYLFKPGHNYLGRKMDNDLVLLDNAASAHHAEIYYDKSTNSLTIWDFESTNGTFVNGNRLSPGVDVEIAHGDQLQFGLVALEFRVD